MYVRMCVVFRCFSAWLYVLFKMIFLNLINNNIHYWCKYYFLHSWILPAGFHMCTMLAGLLRHLLAHHYRSYSRMLFTRCVPLPHLDAPRTMLHSRAEILTHPRFPAHFHHQFRGVKSRNRKFKGQEEEWRSRNKTILTYIAAAGVGMIGLSYAAVPLYRLYCQVCWKKYLIKFDYCFTLMTPHVCCFF